jgi:hypothetical protein
MTARSKAFFITGQPVTTSRKFLQNNRPTEDTFRDLFDSIPFKAEIADTATESVHGLVKLANAAQILAKTNTSSGFQLVARPSHLPSVGVTAEPGYDISSQNKLEGIMVTEGQEPNGNLKYLINLLFHTDFFKIRSGGSEELTMSDSFINSWNALLELIDGGSPNVELADFPSGVFEDGGIINHSGVFTVDTDDSTMHIDPVTKKVQIKDGGVTLDKLQNLNAGEIIVAPTGGGTPEVISLLGAGKILVGTATGVEVKDINDYLLAINISDNSIKARKLDPGTLGDGITKDMAASDASKLKVNLSAAASMEFSGGALQLKNDDSNPDAQCYYGTGSVAGSNDKGYFSLANRSILRKLEYSLGVGETIIIIDSDTDLLVGEPAGAEITTMHVDVLINTGGNNYSPDVAAVIEYDMTDDIVNNTIITGLTEGTDYIINVMYIKTN